MFKKSLLFMMLLTLFGVARAQSELTVYDGTATSNVVPAYIYYFDDFTRVQHVIPAADLAEMNGKTITMMKYYTTSSNVPYTTVSQVQVYLMEVDYTTISALEPIGSGTVVYEGTFDVVSEGDGGSLTIEFDTPYAYGGGNLLVGIDNTTDLGYKSIYFYGQTVTGAGWGGSNGTSLEDVTGSTRSFIPKTTFTYVGSGPICEKPSTFEIYDGSLTQNSVTLTWEGGSGNYNLQYKKSTDDEYTTHNTSSTAFSLENLQPGTTYQARVQSVCSEEVSGWKSLSFTTLFGIPLVESFGSSIPNGWEKYSGLVDNVVAGGDLTATTSGWYFGTANGVFDEHARVNIYGTSCNYWLVTPAITMENNVQLKFDVAYTAYSGTAADPQTTGTDDKFVVLVNANGTWSILRQWDNAGSDYVLNNLGVTPVTMKIDLSAYAGQEVAVAFYGESTVSNADNNLHIDNVSIDYIPACDTPSSLAVNYTGGTTATVTWDMADKCDIDVNGTVYTNKTSPFQITGLEYGTIYEVKARQNCGAAGTSEWVDAVSFVTDFCPEADMCQITLELKDSYGDGWNGAALLAYDYFDPEEGTIVLIGSFTLDSGASASYTLNVCDGRSVIFMWQTGNYDSECSYAVYDPQGDEIFSGSGAFTSDYEWYDVFCNTDCRKPSDFTASNISGHEVTLSWTENGPATEWTIYYMASTDEEVSSVVVTTNPYTFEGLDPLTTYYAQVVPTCEADKPSDVIHWTMDEACPKPHITVDPVLPTSATVSWTGFADNYSFEWAVGPDAEEKDPYVDGNWYYYDNGTYVGSVGLGGGEFHWGVMFPAGTYDGSLVSSVKAYDINAMVGTLAIYNDGDTAPSNQISIQDIEFTGASAWVEFPTEATIDPTKNLWIVFDAVDGAAYPIGTCNDDNGDANGRWVEINGTWYDMANVGVTGRANMVRAYIENGVDPDELDWQPITGATSPVTLDNLTEDKDYYVRIKSICGGEDGESEWQMTHFHTPTRCATPSDLNAEPAARTAELSWTGYTENFAVKYRHAEVADPTAPAIIILEAHDVWEDGTGYQMLLDADATAYGDIIPETGNLSEKGSGEDAPAEVYAEFEYKIPVDADGALTTTNIVADGSVTIQIPAGTYDWCITNPTPDDCMYIAADGGDVACRNDDYVFEAGVTYHFTMGKFGSGDGAALEITRPMSDWITVENVTSPYTLTGLTPLTYHEWQVQGLNCSGTDNTEWSDIESFFTTEETTVTQTIALEGGSVKWVSFNVNITLDNLKAAIVEVLSSTDEAIIKSKNQTLTYKRGRWSGQLTELNLAQMYLIKVSSSCEIAVTGMPIDATTLTATLTPGVNYIAYPYNTSIATAELFAGFVIDNDAVKSKNQTLTYKRGRWSGQLVTLEPGNGYIFNSAGTSDRPFTFPTLNKGGKGVQNTQNTTTTGPAVNKTKSKTVELNPVELNIVDYQSIIINKLRNYKRNRLNK